MWNFTVLELTSTTGRADQMDDQALCQRMRTHLSQMDELVLLTADGDYLETVLEALRNGCEVTLIHFGPLSQRYRLLQDRIRIVEGTKQYWRLIYPGERLSEL